jgi:hypothetical protein
VEDLHLNSNGKSLGKTYNMGASTASLGDTLSTAAHDDVEIHTIDTDSWVVLDSKIDVLGDTEAEVTGLREVALAELVLLDLEATLQNLLSLWSTDGDVNGDLFVTTDTKGTDSITGLALKILAAGLT